MTTSDQAPKGSETVIRSLADVTQAAEGLATVVFEAADLLASDSASVALSVNSSLEATELMEEWPISGSFAVRGLFRSRLESAGRGLAILEDNAASVAGLDSSKYSPDILGEAYPDAERPALAFSADLVRWAEGLVEKEREIVLMINLGESDDSRVEVSVYEDVPVSRSYINSFTDGTYEEPGEVRESAYRWVGDRAVICGTPDQLAILDHATQSR